LTKIKASVWIQEKNEGDFPLERVTGRTRILVGYFQKRIYVEPVASEILNAMSNSSLFKKVVSTPTKNDIAVHIRLGDYVSEPAAKRSHGLSNIEYFVRAVALLQAKHDYNKVVIYSDDSQAAYTEFVNAFGRSKIPITISSGTNEYEDLAGISSSKGIVISNSTFSWWAAWIGTHLHDCVVIAPRPWFSKPSKADDHLLLDSWIVIDRLLPAIEKVFAAPFTAIESGTYKGRTAKHLADLADHVTTIEAEFEHYRKSKKRLQKRKNVTVLYGDSSDLIRAVLPPIKVNCIMWLDAHYSGGSTTGKNNPCPLTNELLQILPVRNASNTIIFIDDSRGLIGSSGWPILSDLVIMLNKRGYSSIIIDDVLIASSAEILQIFAVDFERSRTYIFESLGGRMTLISVFVKAVGLVMRLAFKVKHMRKISTQ
jgi:hypothetical protein